MYTTIFILILKRINMNINKLLKLASRFEYKIAQLKTDCDLCGEKIGPFNKIKKLTNALHGITDGCDRCVKTCVYCGENKYIEHMEDKKTCIDCNPRGYRRDEKGYIVEDWMGETDRARHREITDLHRKKFEEEQDRKINLRHQMSEALRMGITLEEFQRLEQERLERERERAARWALEDEARAARARAPSEEMTVGEISKNLGEIKNRLKKLL